MTSVRRQFGRCGKIEFHDDIDGRVAGRRRGLPDQPVLVVTQTANDRARKLAGRLGFTEVDTFQAHDAEQTLAAALHSFRAS